MLVPVPVLKAVNEYLAAVDARMPGFIEGFYLVGSVALGDFRPRSSDIDYVAVTRANPDQLSLPRRPRMDGILVTFEDISAGKCNPVTLYMLAHNSIALRGPARDGLRVPDDPAGLANWIRMNAQSYWTPLLNDAARPVSPWGVIAATGYGTAWIVSGISRQHYTLATGDICSKEAACHHALRTFPKRWHRVIQECLRVREADMADPSIGGIVRELLAARSLYNNPLARRKDVIEFGRFALASMTPG